MSSSPQELEQSYVTKKKLKDQLGMSYQPYGNYNTAGSMASGYPASRPSTHASSTISRLPSIGTQQNTFLQTNLRLRRTRPGSGLQLGVTALPNAPGYQPTLPRERLAQLHRLSSSDSKAIEQLRSPGQTHVRTRGDSSDDNLLLHGRMRSKPSQFNKVQKETEVLSLGLQHQRPPSSSMQASHPQSPRRPLYSGNALPPIGTQTQSAELVHTQEETEDGKSDQDAYDESCSETSSDLEDELFSEGSEAPPSRPGFESDAEQSGYFLNIPFPDVNKSSPYPATLIQDQAQLDTDRFAAATNASGLSARVDNIVRGFRIHGPLDKELLQKALNQVASLHPLLRASFQRTRDKLYIQTPTTGDGVSVSLESPIIGHEHSQDLVTNARRKIFELSMKTTLVQSNTNCSRDDDLVINAFSLTSVAGSDSSDRSPASMRGLHKRVSFAPPIQPVNQPTTIMPGAMPQLPSIGQEPQMEDTAPLLFRAKISSKGLHEHILVLSFPRIICDFWSSCLFCHQLSDAYAKLEKCSSYRPSLAASRIESKRQAVINAHDKMKSCGATSRRDAASRLLQKRTQASQKVTKGTYIPPFPSFLHFQQVAQRENQLILMLSREKLWGFWESMVTAIIQRQRGPNRVKVVPPIRIPSGLGEKLSKIRPPTSRLRPLTASRNRPQTAKRGSGFVGDAGVTRETLAGPKTKFQYMKIEGHVCETFKQSLPEDYLSYLKEDELFSLMCLGAYVLMLGKCCRGWGADEGMVRGRGDGASGNLIEDSRADFTTVVSETTNPRPHFPPDPLQRYKVSGISRVPKPVVLTQSSPSAVRNVRRATITGKLDLGSFLIGMEVSLRHSEPQKTQGLFGPLTNDGGIRVNLHPRETFADLLLSLWRSILLARKHGHFPFPTVAEEVGLARGLPIKFSYLHRRDIVQLTNPNDFYFPETAMGVEGQGLARFGSTCYLTPLNGKMDDSCHFELLLWESYDGDGVCGGIRYQPQIIKKELVESFSHELCRLVATIASDPCRSLLDLAQEIHPPFLNSGRARKYKTYRKSTAAVGLQ